MIKWKIAIFVAIILSAHNAFSQTNAITGTVTDASGESLPGVSIVVQNTTNGTTTDIDGNYTIEDVNASDQLVFSFIGMTSQVVTVGDQTIIDINLQESTESLEEVIVVGYGSQKKSNVVGSVVSVDVEEATATPTTNVSEMLRGRAAGVQVSLSDARPGSCYQAEFGQLPLGKT